MTTDTGPRDSSARIAQGGPPLGVLAVVSTGFFVASLVAGSVLAGGTVPSPVRQRWSSP